ncbi:MAG: AAA+ family ATPase, partial [Candidatus Sericytochromatia bacterium]|nr:AAA+ family ATPase [Candidatus Tanganyikabacteria bacterium]
MAITNQERVGKAMDLLKDGLAPFVERELKAQDAQGWLGIVRQSVAETQVKLFKDDAVPKWDAASLLAVVWNQWNTVFRKTLGQSERTLVSELRDVRNRWAHQTPFSSDDADRALDSMARLLTAVSAPQADDVNKMKLELRRLTFDEQVRSEKRKAGGSLIEAAATGTLKPWREIVTPHADVATGRYQQAEFAADLWQVHLGEG